MSQHPTVLAGRRYRKDHPEVDFSTQTIMLRQLPDGGYEAYGHEPRDPEIEAMFNRCCCHPWLARHHGAIGRAQRLKWWLNRRFPIWRRCMKPWCWRGQTYQYRCHKHQESS